jgi:FkbM family methyltransferase
MEFVTYRYFDDEEYNIKVSKKTCELTPYTFLKNGKLWENLSLQQFFRNIDNQRKLTIVDVGAQSGLYSLFAKFLPNSTFYSFEPYSPTFDLLNENLILNNIKNVNTYNMGLSNNSGYATLNTCISHNGLHTMGNVLKRFQDVNQINIKTITMDDFFFKNDIPIDYLKIDTEGFEYWILMGGIKTINKYKPIIQLEWNIINMEQCGVTESMLNDIMNDFCYNDITIYQKNEEIEERMYAPCSVV